MLFLLSIIKVVCYLLTFYIKNIMLIGTEL